MKHPLKYMLAVALLAAGPAWAEEDLPLPVAWGGTGTKTEAKENAPAPKNDDAPTQKEAQKAAIETTVERQAPAPQKVEVRGWDPKAKQPITRAPAP